MAVTPDDLLKAIKTKSTSIPTQTTYSSKTNDALKKALSRGSTAAPVQKSGGGGIGGFFGKALSVIDLPRALVTSAAKEITDAFQGEGFNFGEFIDQTKNHYGFGDFIRDEGIDLGKWGNRALGFVGDVALDPLTYAGGLGVYARARGGKGLADDLVGEFGKLQKITKKTPLQQQEMNALGDAITAAGGKGGSVSKARTKLIRDHGDVGEKLVKDFGIETGLRMRAPGTGPLLGRLTRDASGLATRRAKQIPQFYRRSLDDMLSSQGYKTSDEAVGKLVKEAGRKKTYRKMDSAIPDEARQILARAAKMPVESNILGLSRLGKGGVVAGIMSSPNQGWEKIASSKMGERFSRVFTDPESMVVNRLTRSTDPNDVILGNTLRKGYNRGSGKQNFIQDEGFKDRKAFIKAVKLDPDLPRNIGMNTLEKTTALSPELGDTIMDAVRRGVDPAEAIDLVAGPGFADNVLAQFDNKMSLEQIGKIILGHHDQYVAANDISRLISPSLYGNSAEEVAQGAASKFVNQADSTLQRYGGYTPHYVVSNAFDILKRLPADNKGNVESLFNALNDDTGELLTRAANSQDVKNRIIASNMQNRVLTPSAVVQNEAGEWVIEQGFVLRIPDKNTGVIREIELKRSFPQDPNATMKRSVRQYIDEGNLVSKTEQVPIDAAERKARQDAFNMRNNKNEPYWDTQGRSVPEQIDAAFKEAGWLDEGDSLFPQSYGLREDSYLRRTGRDARLRGLEEYLAKQGIIVNADTLKQYADTLRTLDDAAGKSLDELANLSSKEIANLNVVEALQRIGVAVGDDVDAADIEKFFDGLGPEGKDLRVKVEKAVKEAVEALGEGADLETELLQLEDELELIMGLKVGKREEMLRGIDGDSESGPFAFDADNRLDNPEAFAIDAIRQIGPILGDLTKLTVRHDLVKTGTTKFGKLIQALSEMPNSEKIVDNLLSLREDMVDSVEFIDDQLIPHLRNLIDQGMEMDETVVAFEKMSESLRLAREGVDDRLTNQPSVKGLSQQANRILNKFNKTMADIGELEDVLHLSTLTNGYELSAQEISQRLAAVGTRLSDEAGQVFGTEVGEKIQRMFTPRLLLEGEQVTPNALRNATNKVIRDAGKSIDQANPVGQTLRDRILTRQPVGQVERPFLGTPRADAVEMVMRSVDPLPSPRSPNFWEDVNGVLANSRQPWLNQAWTQDELLEASALIERYDQLNRAKGVGTSRANFLATENIVSSFEAASDELAANLARIQAEMAATPENQQTLAYELLQRKEQILQISVQRNEIEQQIIAEGMTPAIRARDEFAEQLTGDLNKLGGELEVKNVAPEQIQNLWKSSGDQQWGNWRLTSGSNVDQDDFHLAMLASQKMNDIGEVKSWLKAYDRVHNWMKAQMVATPGFVMRNIMGGMANMWFADIPIDETFRTIRLITQAMNQGDGNLEAGLRKLVANNPEDIEFRNALQLVQLNAHGGGQATSSVDIKMGKSSWFDYVVGTKKSVGQGGVPANYRSANIRVNPLDAGFFLFSGVRNANSIAESAMRLGTGLHSMRVGRNLDDAVDEIFRLHFDYSKLSGAESNIAKRFVPFYTWTRNNLPLQISFLAQNPAKFNKMMALRRNMESESFEDKNVADYMLEPYGFKLPFKIGDSVTYFTPDLPLQDLIRMDPTAEGGKRVLEQLASAATPFVKVPIEYWAEKKVFAGIPYQDKPVALPAPLRLMPGLKEAAKALGWAKQNRKGQWLINDKKLGIIEGMLPFIGRLRRIIPEDAKTQETWLQTALSTGAGLSIKINTPRRQRSQRIREKIKKSEERRKRRDWNRTIV
jgi:hypothetical protein|tara:strand:+ start:797 stop:6226 length:5430 start_codon:yes stop_codon:yes gene_type:complete